MATQIRFRRGNTTGHNTFTGATGEMTVDTTKNTLVVHDGSTVGGFPVAKEMDMTTLQSDINSNQLDMGTLQTDITSLEARSTYNYLINGNFDFWQRNTTQTTTGYGSADRWWFDNITGAERYLTTHPDGSYASIKITPDGSNDINMRQFVVGSGVFLNGQEVTLSFWAKADSARSINSSVNTLSSTAHSLTTSWQRFTHTVTVGGSHSNTSVDFTNQGSSSVPYYITQVQLEKGGHATGFAYRGTGYEYSLCQIFFEKSYRPFINLESTSAWRSQEHFRIWGLTSPVSQELRRSVKFSVTKPFNPTVTIYSSGTGIPGKAYEWTTGGNGDVNASAGDTSTSGFTWIVLPTGSLPAVTIGSHWSADCEVATL